MLKKRIVKYEIKRDYFINQLNARPFASIAGLLGKTDVYSVEDSAGDNPKGPKTTGNRRPAKKAS